MASNDNSTFGNDELQQLIGALNLIDLLREEMEQWREEAQDESKHECLDNVTAHIAAIEAEYKRRVAAQRQGLAG